MRKYDIVYILKADASDRELRYSLRSVEKNLPHRKVWFYCGKPAGLEPDEYVRHKQVGESKGERVRSSLIEACKNDKITKRFWLFNDDFFVLRPMTSEKPYFNGMLRDRIDAIDKKRGRQTNYTKELAFCESLLKSEGFTTFAYDAIHIPMLIQREKMLEVLETYPTCNMARSLYGNIAMIGGNPHENVKVKNGRERLNKEADFVSTDDNSFNFGMVGQDIRSMFREKSRFEK